MKAPRSELRHQAARIFALLAVAVLYGMAQLPSLSSVEGSALVQRFQFSASPLPEVPAAIQRTVRPVHPSLEHISAWISSVGAAVALYDLDGDGLPNDVCYVETRTDQVIVAPVPGTPARYEPFAIDPAPVAYEARTMAPMGCLPGDMNEDGRSDILVYYWGRTPIAFLRLDANGIGPDAYQRQEIVPGSERWYTNAATFADLDGDGHADLVIGNYFPDGARILDDTASGREAMQHSMSRADNGGRNRLLLWAGASGNGQREARFTDASEALDHDVAHGWTLAVGAADLDGDQLPELYFANDFGPDRLLHNRSQPGKLLFAGLDGRKTVTMPNSKVLGRDSFKGMGVDFGDVNGDGLLDIYVSNIAAEYALQESHFLWASTGDTASMTDGVAPYVDASEPLGLSRSGWAWESRLADFDNDGVLEALQAIGFVSGQVDRWPELQELAMGNDELVQDPRSWPRIKPGDDLSGGPRNSFFVRSARGIYFDIAPQLALDPPNSSYVSRGIAVADVDGDGRLDYAVANQWAPSIFYRNTSPTRRAFLGLHLRWAVDKTLNIETHPGHPTGIASRPAIGATAKVLLPDGRQLVAQVDGGNGHSGKRSPDLHFGLGQVPADTPLRVEVQWRDADGRVQRETLHLKAGWHSVLLGGA